jgi:hypothetical protein
MDQLQTRLAKAVATLDKIAATRIDSHNPGFGENTERLLIAREIAEIEKNILEDPGDLERFLVRVR